MTKYNFLFQKFLLSYAICRTCSYMQLWMFKIHFYWVEFHYLLAVANSEKISIGRDNYPDGTVRSLRDVQPPHYILKI